MIQILTPTGYIDISTATVGTQVKTFVPGAAVPVINTITAIQYADATEWARWWDGQTVPSFDFYLINGTFTINREQSIWASMKVVHAKDLNVGDTIYNDTNHPVTITSISTVSAAGWWRLEVDGNHLYTIDGFVVHNASRFWVGGTGTWDSSTTTHWAPGTGGTGGSSVPGSADNVTFDGSSGGGIVTVNFGGTVTIATLTCGAFTGTLDFSANNNSVTLTSSPSFNGSGSGTRTINLGNGTWNLNGTTNTNTAWNLATVTGLTFNANSSTIAINSSNTQSVTFSGGGQTYNNLTINNGRGGVNFSGLGNIFATLTINAPCSLILPASITQTITNLVLSSQTSSNPIGIFCASPTLSNVGTISSANSPTLSWVVVRNMTFTGGGTFTAINSFDLGTNSGITITAPSGGGSGPIGQFISAQRGTPY